MNVVVTGSSSGIGLAVARRFLAAGYAVCGIDVAKAALDEPGYTHVRRDIRDVAAGELEGIPQPEVLVNNAGTLDEDLAIEVNLVATMGLTRRLVTAPGLRSVVFVASASARNGAEFPNYVASKAGIVGYMKNLALGLAPRGVTVNAVSPGGVVTPANAHILDDERLYAEVLAETLLGKWAEADEVAELVFYLAAVNRSITGEDILMDNGEMLRSNFVW